jgi:hypothetical protein
LLNPPILFALLLADLLRCRSRSLSGLKRRRGRLGVRRLRRRERDHGAATGRPGQNNAGGEPYQTLTP